MEIVLSCDFVDTTISSGAHSLSLFRFPLLSYDFLLFRLYLSLSIFTHCTSSDTAFHFPCSFSFSQKCRGERHPLRVPCPIALYLSFASRVRRRQVMSGFSGLLVDISKP